MIASSSFIYYTSRLGTFVVIFLLLVKFEPMTNNLLLGPAHYYSESPYWNNDSKNHLWSIMTLMLFSVLLAQTFRFLLSCWKNFLTSRKISSNVLSTTTIVDVFYSTAQKILCATIILQSLTRYITHHISKLIAICLPFNTVFQALLALWISFSITFFTRIGILLPLNNKRATSLML